MTTGFSGQLAAWRKQRRMSQLGLALDADVSARHVSFLETGRAAPSRTMVLRLAEALDLPLAARNALLGGAGFAPLYESRKADDAEIALVRAAMQRIIDRHDPYPAFILDRHWRLMAANGAGKGMMALFKLSDGDSLLDAMMSSQARALFDNWPDVARHMIARLKTESAYLGGDAVLDAAIAALRDQQGEAAGPVSAVMQARYRWGDQILSFFSVIAQIGAADDVALADLKIEMLFPADAPTKAMLEAAN